MIRPTTPEDTPALVELAQKTGVFKSLEIVALREVLDDYHETEQQNGHRSITEDCGGKPIGFAYYAPASMTDRGWYLYWIAIDKPLQGQGTGSRLLDSVEAEVRNQGGRMLLIETSSTPHYEPTRRFYVKHGYVEVSRLDDFYADGDALVVFGKRFLPKAD
ncbi:GNAT family N-acetyltransferase [Singulisphaera rosea]